MPELVEVERYRLLAEQTLGRRIVEVMAPDAWYLKRGLSQLEVQDALRGCRPTSARRIGKLLLVDTSAPRRRTHGSGPTIGLRFGMTGRLVVDGRAALDDLVHASNRELEAWDRFALRFDDGGDLRIRDPRRLGGVELDPDESRLGPDALAVAPAALRRALVGARGPLKARLMDQARLAGLGNLAVDEALWRAGLDPARPGGSLSPVELRRLHRHVVGTLGDLLRKGGSHAGDLMDQRRSGGVCPKDGRPLVRRTIGGRTTWSCPLHQR